VDIEADFVKLNVIEQIHVAKYGVRRYLVILTNQNFVFLKIVDQTRVELLWKFTHRLIGMRYRMLGDRLIGVFDQKNVYLYEIRSFENKEIIRRKRIDAKTFGYDANKSNQIHFRDLDLCLENLQVLLSDGLKSLNLKIHGTTFSSVYLSDLSDTKPSPKHQILTTDRIVLYKTENMLEEYSYTENCFSQRFIRRWRSEDLGSGIRISQIRNMKAHKRFFAGQTANYLLLFNTPATQSPPTDPNPLSLPQKNSFLKIFIPGIVDFSIIFNAEKREFQVLIMTHKELTVLKLDF
jgi:hypothetical protein